MTVQEAEEFAINRTMEMIKVMLDAKADINKLLPDSPVRKHLNLIYEDISSYIVDLERMKGK